MHVNVTCGDSGNGDLIVGLVSHQWQWGTRSEQELRAAETAGPHSDAPSYESLLPRKTKYRWWAQPRRCHTRGRHSPATMSAHVKPSNYRCLSPTLTDMTATAAAPRHQLLLTLAPHPSCQRKSIVATMATNPGAERCRRWLFFFSPPLPEVSPRLPREESVRPCGSEARAAENRASGLRNYCQNSRLSWICKYRAGRWGPGPEAARLSHFGGDDDKAEPAVGGCVAVIFRRLRSFPVFGLLSFRLVSTIMMEEIDRFQVPAVRAEMQPLVREAALFPGAAPLPWGCVLPVPVRRGLSCNGRHLPGCCRWQGQKPPAKGGRREGGGQKGLCPCVGWNVASANAVTSRNALAWLVHEVSVSRRLGHWAPVQGRGVLRGSGERRKDWGARPSKDGQSEQLEA